LKYNTSQWDIARPQYKDFSMINTTISKIWVLRLGSRFLGVDPLVFKQVLEVNVISTVPLTPRPLLGLLSNLGQIVPVFDLSHTLNIDPIKTGIAALLEFEGQPLAIMIDEVVGLRTNLSGVWTAPSQEPLFSAILEEGGSTVQILEVRSLFAHLSMQMSSPARTSATFSRPLPQA